MDEIQKHLKELIAKLALMHEKIEQGVYANNLELLHEDFEDYYSIDLVFQETTQDYIDDNSEGAKFPWEKR